MTTLFQRKTIDNVGKLLSICNLKWKKNEKSKTIACKIFTEINLSGQDKQKRNPLKQLLKIP